MDETSSVRKLAQGAAPKEGRFLKALAIALILILPAALLVVSYPARQDAGLSGETTLVGFALMMLLLTIAYLVAKDRAATRRQDALIERRIQEQAAARAVQLDPIMEFHHPEVCREILLRQANYAARMNSPVSLVELTIPELVRLWEDGDTRPAMADFFQEIKRNCRALDFCVRWTPNSLLLVLLDMEENELAGVVCRLRERLERWWGQRTAVAPRMEWRYMTTGRLGGSGDVLGEVRDLLAPERFVPTSVAGVWEAKEPMSAAARRWIV
jgi:hypothetical protein